MFHRFSIRKKCCFTRQSVPDALAFGEMISPLGDGASGARIRMRFGVTKDDMEIVSAKVHECLADRVGKNRFELWFSTGVNLRVEGQSLQITAADTFKLERIRRSFTHDLAQAGLTVLGFAPQLKFLVNPLLAGVTASPSTSSIPVLSVVSAETTGPASSALAPLPLADRKSVV